MTNKSTYQLKKIVKKYTCLDELFKPELTIFWILKNRLANMRMLDIGVGGGRTTFNFAPLVKEYLGIDYSQQMIDACKRRFPKHSDRISFKLMDVRSMKTLKDNYFDFVLASSNGLDYMPHNDRIKALKEIKRVGKKGGYFCFSTHNLLSIDKLLQTRLSLNPIDTFRSIIRHLSLRISNKNFGELKKKDYALINDGSHRFRLLTYYIQPKQQILQLKDLKFKNIRVFSPETGKEIKERSKIHATTDGIHYGLSYLCNF